MALSGRSNSPDASLADNRRHPRRAVYLDAWVYPIDFLSDVVIQNVSTNGFMGEADVELTVGETLHLTLDDRAYQTGSVRWTDGRHFGVEFETHLARMSDGEDMDFGSSEDHRPRPRRAIMSIPAQLCLGRSGQPATVRNLSQSGMLLESESQLSAGQHVLVKLGDRSPVAAVVKWRSDQHIGVETAEPVGILSLVYSSD
jgi:hypothetical protein